MVLPFALVLLEQHHCLLLDYIAEKIPMFTLSEYRNFTVAMRKQKYHEKHLGVGVAKGGK